MLKDAKDSLFKPSVSIILRCKECLQIPFIRSVKDVPKKIEIKCKCGIHSIESLSDYLNLFTEIKETDQPCSLCQNKEKKFVEYCPECNHWICEECLIRHKEMMKSHMTSSEQTILSFICKEHNEPCNYYCKKCQKHICEICLNDKFHKDGKHITMKLHLDYNNNKISKGHENIIKANNYLTEIKNIKEGYVKLLQDNIDKIELAYREFEEINKNLMDLVVITYKNCLLMPNNFYTISNFVENCRFNDDKFEFIKPDLGNIDKLCEFLSKYSMINGIYPDTPSGNERSNKLLNEISIMYSKDRNKSFEMFNRNKLGISNNSNSPFNLTTNNIKMIPSRLVESKFTEQSNIRNSNSPDYNNNNNNKDIPCSNLNIKESDNFNNNSNNNINTNIKIGSESQNNENININDNINSSNNLYINNNENENMYTNNRFSKFSNISNVTNPIIGSNKKSKIFTNSQEKKFVNTVTPKDEIEEQGEDQEEMTFTNTRKTPNMSNIDETGLFNETGLLEKNFKANNIKTCNANRGSVSYILFLPQFQKLISCSQDLHIRVIDCESMTEYLSANASKVHKDTILYMELITNPNDEGNSNIVKLVSCSYDGVVVLWELNIFAKTMKVLQKYKPHSKPILKVIQLNESEFVSCSYDNKIIVWSFKPSYKILKVLNGHNDRVNSIIRLKVNSKFLVSCSSDDCVKLWKIPTFACEKTIEGVKGMNKNSLIEWSDDNNYKVIVCGYDSVTLINLENYELDYINNPNIQGIGAAILIKSKYLLLGLENGNAMMLNLKDKNVILEVEKLHNDQILAFDFDDYRDVVFSCSKDKKIKSFELAEE